MTFFFGNIVNMSVVGAMAVMIVLLARHCLRNKPKGFSYALWFPVFFRLLCPFSFSSAYGLIGRINRDTNYIDFSAADTLKANIPQGENLVTHYVEIPTPSVGVDKTQFILLVLTSLWVAGVITLLTYSLVSYLRLKKQVDAAIQIENNIYETDQIASPFVMGIRPRIYLPMGIPEEEVGYILAHEKTHITRKDYLFKPIAYLAVVLHWFNPFVWLAFSLMTRDMEMSCDESVLSRMDGENRKAYSYALLNVSVKNSGILGPIGFGESNVKARIKNIVQNKNVGKKAILISIFLCVMAMFLVLANPHGAKSNGKALGKVLREYTGEELVLNDVVDFDYDYVIQFPPYADKKSMNALLGFHCPILVESVNESMMNLLFVKNNQPICYLYGYGEGNGFYLDLFSGKKIPKERTGTFAVEDAFGYPYYTNQGLQQKMEFHAKADALFEAKNPYIGDFSGNARILQQLSWPENVQFNGTELQTTKEPYGLTLDFVTDNEISTFPDNGIGDSIYYQNAVILLSLIENCGSVSFRFNETKTVTVTREQVEENVGYDVRQMARSREDFETFLHDCNG